MHFVSGLGVKRLSKASHDVLDAIHAEHFQSMRRGGRFRDHDFFCSFALLGGTSSKQGRTPARPSADRHQLHSSTGST
jgi:hypothetical protein